IRDYISANFEQLKDNAEVIDRVLSRGRLTFSYKERDSESTVETGYFTISSLVGKNSIVFDAKDGGLAIVHDAYVQGKKQVPVTGREISKFMLNLVTHNWK